MSDRARTGLLSAGRGAYSRPDQARSDLRTVLPRFGALIGVMGKSHALVGTTFGVLFAGALGDAPLAVRLLLIPVTGGAALLPDMDHPSSRVARSLGPVTKIIAKGVASASLSVYHATRTELDVADRHSGHRTVTHSLAGCLIFGLIALAAVGINPYAGTVLLALLVGLLAQGFKSIGTGFTLTGGAVSWWVLTHDHSWWWVFPVAVTVGAAAHLVAGDYLTNSGVPLLWPMVINGRRWTLLRAPATFSTGTPFESHVVTPLLFVTLGLSALTASGALPLLIRTLL